MKKISFILVFTLIVSFIVSPGFYLVKASGNIEGMEKIKLILDSDEKTVFQVTESDGKTYEYVEELIKEDGFEKIIQKKFLMDENENKRLVDSTNIKVEEFDSGLIIENLDDIKYEKIVIYNNGSTNVIEQDSNTMSTMALKKETGSGGSHIAALRWIEYNDGSATAIDGTKYKYTKKTQWQYRDFRSAANSVVTAEKAILTGGLSAVVDAVWAAVKKGELLSWKLIKKIFGALGKAIPGVGTIITVYTYVDTCKTASDLFKKIP